MTHSTLLLSLISIFYLQTDNLAKFEVKTKRANDRVVIKADQTKTTFIIQSPFGISNAEIQRTSEKWPDKIVIQLQLQGLESFRLLAKDHVTNLSVSSSSTTSRLWIGENEDSPIDSQNPYWMDVRILDRDGKPTKNLPLQDGCFEFTLPSKVFDANPRSIKLEWIDFYRN